MRLQNYEYSFEWLISMGIFLPERKKSAERRPLSWIDFYIDVREEWVWDFKRCYSRFLNDRQVPHVRFQHCRVNFLR